VATADLRIGSAMWDSIPPRGDIERRHEQEQELEAHQQRQILRHPACDRPEQVRAVRSRLFAAPELVQYGYDKT